MENRRRFPRIDASFQIKYHPISNISHFGYTIADDVSRGGLGMPALSEIAKNGSVIKLNINNRDGDGVIAATGKIKWSRALKRKGVLDEKVGIEFLDISPFDIDRLVRIK